jgi:hypothetical protein
VFDHLEADDEIERSVGERHAVVCLETTWVASPGVFHEVVVELDARVVGVEHRGAVPLTEPDVEHSVAG